MKLFLKKPIHPLNAVVKSLWKLELSPEDVPYSQIYFPYGSFELICYLQNPGIMNYLGCTERFAQPQLCYSGPLTRPFQMEFNQPTSCLGVSLKPWVGNLLYQMPGNEFTNQIVDLNLFEKPELDISGEKNDDELFRALESYLAQRIKLDCKDSVVEFLACTIIKNPTRQALNSCLDQIGMSRRRIEQRFLNGTGLSMGMFTRKARFQKAVRDLNSFSEGKSLTEIGLDVGYFDQSHFISEFKEFAALSPSKFLSHKSELKDLLVSMV